MRNISILIFEAVIVIVLVFAGLSGRNFLFIQGARSATLTLGIIGMLLCILSVGKFISAAPAHPLSILGYLLGAIAMAAFLTQLLHWSIPKLENPQTALIVLALAMFAKSVIARFSFLITK